MGLPCISTNFSGPTALLSAKSSYPLPPQRALPDGMAEPGLGALRQAMRAVQRDPKQGRARGQQARADMVREYSQQHVARLTVGRLQQIAQEIAPRAEPRAARQ